MQITELKSIDFKDLPEEIQKQLQESDSRFKTGSIFDEYYIKPLNVFLDKHKEIPNVYKIHLSDPENFSKHFEKEYSEQIESKKEVKAIYNGKDWEQETVFYWLKTGELIHITDYLEIYTEKDFTLANEMKVKLKKYIYKTKKENKVWLLLASAHGLKTIPFKLDKQKLDIDANYNDEFKEINAKILSKIDNKKSKGIYLFHGIPGAGKTTYVKFLASQTKKKVIFLSPQIAANLHQPEFTEFLFSNSGCILVIEDAELLIESRDKSNSPVSSILNIADGLLSDELKIQIICTFNTDLSNIDEAVLRKGRLQAIYKFEKLTKVKTQNLIDKLYPGKEIIAQKEMTVAEVYNLEDENFLKEKVSSNQIGFGRK